MPAADHILDTGGSFFKTFDINGDVRVDRDRAIGIADGLDRTTAQDHNAQKKQCAGFQSFHVPPLLLPVRRQRRHGPVRIDAMGQVKIKIDFPALQMNITPEAP